MIYEVRIASKEANDPKGQDLLSEIKRTLQIRSIKKTDRKSGEKLLLCPRCKKYMKKLIKQKIVIDICETCGGMWVDSGELEKLANLINLKGGDKK